MQNFFNTTHIILYLLSCQGYVQNYMYLFFFCAKSRSWYRNTNTPEDYLSNKLFLCILCIQHSLTMNTRICSLNLNERKWNFTLAIFISSTIKLLVLPFYSCVSLLIKFPRQSSFFFLWFYTLVWVFSFFFFWVWYEMQYREHFILSFFYDRTIFFSGIVQKKYTKRILQREQFRK